LQFTVFVMFVPVSFRLFVLVYYLAVGWYLSVSDEGERRERLCRWQRFTGGAP